jgi:prenylcysteine oxidase/farnesylcysteine lyase
MKSLFLLSLPLLTNILVVNGDITQQVLHDRDIPIVKSVAIIGKTKKSSYFFKKKIRDTNEYKIGGGASGTSTAFWLSNVFPNAANVFVTSTIFERNSYLGGRSTTVPIKDDFALGTIELGASIFVEANKNLMKATEKFNLKRTTLTALADQVSTKSRPGLGVWDGNDFLFEETGSYWDSMKAIWRYGLTPLKVSQVTNVCRNTDSL